jgi:hypothetical protein
MGVYDRESGGGPESRLWAAVVERGQEPERLDQTESTRPDEKYSRLPIKPNMRVEVASLEPHKFAGFIDVDGAPVRISTV